MSNPYDEFPYRSYPIEWSAPERLAFASLVHGGPRTPPVGYRVLEVGCADGANLLPLAWHRRHASFVGIDSSIRAIETAQQRVRDLGLQNIEFGHQDIIEADPDTLGRFHFIIVHGVFSWVPIAVRDALLRLCTRCLEPGGLLYFNYNTMPGWAMRGMVREFVLGQTAQIDGLRARSLAGQEACRTLADALAQRQDHPYHQLLESELRLVCDGRPSYIAHEYLSPENQAYWRSDVLALAEGHGLQYVAEADFDQPWANVRPEFTEWMKTQDIRGRAPQDTMDLLRNRQLHSPIFTPAPFTEHAPQADELSAIWIESSLTPSDEPTSDAQKFEHPSGQTVEISDDELGRGLLRLAQTNRRALPLAEVVTDAARLLDDLLLLHRNALVKLWCSEPETSAQTDALATAEAGWGRYRTSSAHVRVDLDEDDT